MRLAALLATWSDWLALFPPEQAAPLGELLLRLSPMLDPLRRRAGAGAVNPAGVGDIVTRGRYERLLISEWALADAVPDEFLRRAANGELLFTGPEPMHSDESLSSVALFDAGPSQLGAARLVHMAMLILLARRAELAGARFQWGILQQPGQLHDELGAKGVRLLLDARTLDAPDDAAIGAWDAALDDALGDCWIIGDPDTPRPPAAHARVDVRRAWLEAGLEVMLTQNRRSRTLTLPLPDAADSVRLLRQPFTPPSRAALKPSAASPHSLKRPPLFSSNGNWLAVGLVDGSVSTYHIPKSPGTAPGRPRNAGKLPHVDAIVAAAVFEKAFGALAMADGMLHPFGFPGRFFNKIGTAALPMPAREEFEAAPGALRWAPAFFLRSEHGSVFTEHLLVLDKAKRLVCWSRTSQQRGLAPVQTRFRVLARGVIGALQHGQRLLFAVAIRGRTDVYVLSDGDDKPEHVRGVSEEGRGLLFGSPGSWNGIRGLSALQIADTVWRAGDGQEASDIALERDETVLGAACRNHGDPPGLLVLDRRRTGFVLYSDGERTPLIKATEPVAQAAFDPRTNRLAWIGKHSASLTVRGIGADQPLLQTISGGGAHAR